jgi:hypothetical protein
VSNAKNQKVILPLQIELNQADFDHLQKVTGKDDPTPNVTTWVKYFLAQYVSGGMVVTGQEVQQIEKFLGVRVAKGKDLVDLALKAKGREDGQHVITARLDPVFFGPLEDFCKANGVTPEYVFQDMANSVVENGWLYEWNRQGNRKVSFTERAWERVKKALGIEKPFGEDIANHLDPEGKE